MPRSISGSVNINLAITDENDNGLVKERAAVNASWTQNFIAGAGSAANEVNEIYQAERTLAAAANEELDLIGTLIGNFGKQVNFARIRAIYIELKAGSPNPSGLNIGGAALNAFVALFGDATDVIKLQTEGAILLVSKAVGGYVVTAGTGDRLKILNADGANPATYKIIILGNT